MNTQKPISTISWNSEAFLKRTLDGLLKAHRIDFYCFIRHEPEDDEGGSKPHFHVYVEPSSRIQTAVLKEEFTEPDVRHPEKKPLGVLSFRPSKWSDWYLYGLHDEAYLTLKGQSRRYHYVPDQMDRPDDDEFHYRVSTVDMGDIAPVAKLMELKRSGKTFGQAVENGLVPLPQVKNFEYAWYNFLNVPKTDRGGRSGHVLIDPETGEAYQVDEKYLSPSGYVPEDDKNK